MVGQTELVEQSADMLLHILEGVVGAVGVLDDNDFHLAELVQAVQTTDILAIAARLATEALTIARMLDGELVGSEDDVAVDIGDGHFGSGYHIEPVEGDCVHLALLVGQLASAKTGGFVDHQRRHNLDIASLGGLVEEEVDEGTLQTSTFAFVDRKTSAGNLVAQLKVDDVVFGT